MVSAGEGERWVVFDVGETLVNESRNWAKWAKYIGVPELTFFAVIGAVIADSRPHTEAFSYFRPGFSLTDEVARKAAAGLHWASTPTTSTRTRCQRSLHCARPDYAWPSWRTNQLRRCLSSARSRWTPNRVRGVGLGKA